MYVSVGPLPGMHGSHNGGYLCVCFLIFICIYISVHVSGGPSPGMYGSHNRGCIHVCVCVSDLIFYQILVFMFQVVRHRVCTALTTITVAAAITVATEEEGPPSLTAATGKKILTCNQRAPVKRGHLLAASIRVNLLYL